ncbi:MAG: Sulfur carrier protein ThiS [Planctomycetota bacterium]|jgi:sulfur carrier protein
MMNVIVNGEARELSPGMTIAELIELVGANARYVAVEVNLAVVPRSQHASLRIADGDQIELVTLVGGG